MSRDQLVEFMTRADAATLPTRCAAASWVVAVRSDVDEDWKRGAVHRLTRPDKGKVVWLAN